MDSKIIVSDEAMAMDYEIVEDKTALDKAIEKDVAQKVRDGYVKSENASLIMEIIKMVKDLTRDEASELIGAIEDAKQLHRSGGCSFCEEDLYYEKDGTLITDPERIAEVEKEIWSQND